MKTRQVMKKVKRRFPCCMRIYFWLNFRLVDHFLFLHNKKTLDNVENQLYNGEKFVPTLLEKKLEEDIKIYIETHPGD